MTVLVTGPTGFLGRRVVQKLLDHSYQVRCLVHSPGRERIFPPGSVDVYYGDINDADALAWWQSSAKAGALPSTASTGPA